VLDGAPEPETEFEPEPAGAEVGDACPLVSLPGFELGELPEGVGAGVAVAPPWMINGLAGSVSVKAVPSSVPAQTANPPLTEHTAPIASVPTAGATVNVKEA
jgi:hypothetical protein